MTFMYSKEGLMAAQQLLNRNVGAGLIVDGMFGGKSKTALIKYQTANNLKPTGDFDKATVTKLLSMPINGITTEQIASTMGLSLAVAKDWATNFNVIAIKQNVNTLGRVAAMLATMAVESGGLKKLSENLNYSAAGLAKVSPKRFAGANGTPNALAVRIQRKPEMIANVFYASRMGNGNEASGDGWRYRGRGPIAITGKNNYLAINKAYASYGLDVIKNPDLLCEPKAGIVSACWFWNTNRLNAYADIGDFDGVSDLVNIGKKTVSHGDAIGYAERFDYYDTLLVLLSK